MAENNFGVRGQFLRKTRTVRMKDEEQFIEQLKGAKIVE